MIFWVFINLFILITLRIFQKPEWCRLKIFYPYFLGFFLLISAHSASDGGSSMDVLDEIDELLLLDDDSLLHEIQKATFRYFWDFAHPSSGMIRERNTSGDLVTSGGTGFGIMAILVGIHREFISREQGRDQILKIISFLEKAERFHGAWPHWMNGNNGKVIPFSARDDGGDLVETSFLIQGLLTARQYFNGTDTLEEQLREKITVLWQGVNWNWYRQQVNSYLTWHWSPTHRFDINLTLRGWNETLIAYVLGIASPTHTLPVSLYHRGWAGSNQFISGRSFYGYKLEVGQGTGGPLFFTHYSFMGLDPRNKRDAYANYYFQGQNQALINRAWCAENPKDFKGYAPDCWGLTASDDPDGYRVHAPSNSEDNGTITPTAALSSMPYTPQESMETARHLLKVYRSKVWGPMGFYDAFNPTRNWYANSYLAIDQGPIICMIENYRSGLLWDYFMKNDEVIAAMEKIGFVADSSLSNVNDFLSELEIFPNPAGSAFFIKGLSEEFLEVKVRDNQGRVIYSKRTSTENMQLNLEGLPSGAYFVQIGNNNGYVTRKILLTP